MPVLPEEKIVACLGRCLSLSQAILPSLSARGTSEVSGKDLEEFRRFVDDLERDRGSDSYLSDEAWDWIWKGKTGYNYLQLYGRLAWMNLQLFDLL